MSESELQRQIMLAVAPYARLFRNNVGRLEWKPGEWLNYGLCVGSSDLIGYTLQGRFIAVEVKGPKGRTTPAQQNFIDQVNTAGGIGIIARSVEEVVEVLRMKR